MSLDLLDLNRGDISIPLSGFKIDVNGQVIENLVAVCRPLSFEEIRKVDNMNIANRSHELLLEEEIFQKCFKYFIGLEGIDIDFESNDAGIITTIVEGIKSVSIHYATQFEKKTEEMISQVTFFEIMEARVCSTFNISYNDIKSMPITELLRLNAVYMQAFMPRGTEENE